MMAVSAASPKYEPFQDEHEPDLPAALWLMDTGCGHDLVNDKMADSYPVKTLKKSSRIMFSTANGRIESRNVVPFYCEELAQSVQPFLLHDSPPVLSVGKRCMEQGFTFHWQAGMNPIMTNPQGDVVELEVERNIPYLRAGSEFSHPRPARETKVVAISPMVEEPKDEQTTLCAAGEEVEGIEDADVNEEEYADSDQLDAMMPEGDATPHASDNEDEEHYDAPGEVGDMDPEGMFPSGDVEDAEPAGVLPAGDVMEAPGELPGVVPVPAAPPLGPLAPVRRSAADKLREVAESKEHKLYHLPKNPFCQACIMGKMKERYAHRSQFKRQLTLWGEIVTCDHVYSASAQALGMSGETECFVIKDLWSGLLHAFPVASKSATHVVHCIQQFVGSRKVETLYSDNAKEFIGSAEELMMARDGGQPGVPHTNAMI